MPSEGKGREFESRQVRQKPPFGVVFFVLGGRRTREVSSVAHSDTTALAGPEQREGRVVSPRAIETSAPTNQKGKTLNSAQKNKKYNYL